MIKHFTHSSCSCSLCFGSYLHQIHREKAALNGLIHCTETIKTSSSKYLNIPPLFFQSNTFLISPNFVFSNIDKIIIFLSIYSLHPLSLRSFLAFHYREVSFHHSYIPVLLSTLLKSTHNLDFMANNP